MKKIISLVITLVLVATVFYGCSSNTVQSSEQNTNATSNVQSNEQSTDSNSDVLSNEQNTNSNSDVLSNEQNTNSNSDVLSNEQNANSNSDILSNEQNTDSNNNDSQPSTDKKENDISIFPEVKASPENINVYRQEVSKRLASLGKKDFFVSDEEWEVISNSEFLTGSKTRFLDGFEAFSESLEKLYNYIYPVVYRDGDMLVLWHTTEFGELQFENLDKNGTIESSKGGKVHLANSDEEIVTSEFTRTTTYIQETGEFKVWEFGKVINTCSVPKNSIFCGLSFMEGYIFINGTDVYAINAPGSQINDGTVECIAHNVKEVIDTDYKFSIDSSEQPLFVMNDGSVKCYIGWLGNSDIASDDIAHLFDVKVD